MGMRISICSKYDSSYVMLCQGNSTLTPVLYSKLDKTGNVTWARCADYSSSETTQCIGAFPNGELVFAGGGCTARSFIIKTEVNGNFIWQNQYIDNAIAGSIITDIVAHPDKRITVLDNTIISGSYHIGVYQLDSTGTVLWYKRYESTANKLPNQIISDSTGFTIAGSYSPDHATYHSFFMRIDLNGNLIWFKGYNDGTDNQFVNTAQLDDHSYLFSSQNSIAYHQTRIDSSGTILWNRKMKFDYGVGPMAGDINGYAICAGYYKSAGNGIRPWTSRVHRDSVSFCGSAPALFNIETPVVNTYTATLTKTPISFSSPTVTLYALSVTSNQYNGCTIATSVPADDQKNSMISVFPNPSNSFIHIKCNRMSDNITMNLYDTDGKNIRTLNIKPGDEIKVSRDNLLSGIYFMRFTEDNKVIYTEKIIMID